MALVDLTWTPCDYVGSPCWQEKAALLQPLEAEMNKILQAGNRLTPYDPFGTTLYQMQQSLRELHREICQLDCGTLTSNYASLQQRVQQRIYETAQSLERPEQGTLRPTFASSGGIPSQTYPMSTGATHASSHQTRSCLGRLLYSIGCLIKWLIILSVLNIILVSGVLAPVVITGDPTIYPRLEAVFELFNLIQIPILLILLPFIWKDYRKVPTVWQRRKALGCSYQSLWLIGWLVMILCICALIADAL